MQETKLNTHNSRKQWGISWKTKMKATIPEKYKMVQKRIRVYRVQGQTRIDRLTCIEIKIEM